MSMRLMVMVKNTDLRYPAAKLVLFILAEHAHDDGSNTYPSVARIARDTGLSKRSVRRALKFLDGTGIIMKLAAARQWYSARYCISVPCLKANALPKFRSSARRSRHEEAVAEELEDQAFARM